MDTSTPMLVSRRPIFVYIDLLPWVAAISVPFNRVPVSFPVDASVPEPITHTRWVEGQNDPCRQPNTNQSQKRPDKDSFRKASHPNDGAAAKSTQR